ncbi:DUF3526 domain-containing protein [Gayadomonas joobiniege]|uniref:DUF3526 domain-containing protein n=1 Tax=Gayadomonas joobiniege TaxID=1234606 RepID=UPI000364A8DE|nr:DUF3526 domain-containing protein [Gayadomonas joobiniege]
MSIFSNFSREAKFLFKQKHLWAFYAVVVCLSAFAVYSGISEANHQQATIERLLEKEAIDRENVIAKQKDYGSAAYYTFHLTYSEPSAMAFAAMGQRDIYPWKHRIRMLALEGQIYETDADNPELSFLGRFDFAFLVSILLPLFVILLLHDLRASERSAGRYDLLVVTAKNQHSLWLSRAVILSLSLAAALLIPFVVGAIVSQAPFADVVLMVLVVLAHLLFWMVISLVFVTSKKAIKQSSAQIASVLLSVWLLVTVLVPVVSDLVINKMVTGPSGGEIMLTQREAVNDAWDLPAEDTWTEFLKTHPQWQGKTTMDSPFFEWKWYYAFQQVGDQKASALATAYRDAIIKKDQLAGQFALLSPPMLTQRILSAIATTDTQAALVYQQQIRQFHKSLREFYYPLMFNKAEFSLETLKAQPQYSTYERAHKKHMENN